MRQAVIPEYKLSRARTSTRVLTTLGLTGLFLGLLGAACLTLGRVGFSPSSVSAYYRGDGFSQEAPETLMAAGGTSFQELAEITHTHLMGGSILLFLLCHLLSLCDVRESTRTLWYILSFAGFIAVFGSPWLIVYVHPVFSYLFGPSMVLFLSSLFVLCFIPLREMWFRTP